MKSSEMPESKQKLMDKTKEFADKYKVRTIASVVSAVMLAMPAITHAAQKTQQQNHHNTYKNHLSVKINRKKIKMEKKIEDSITNQSFTDNTRIDNLNSNP